MKYLIFAILVPVSLFGNCQSNYEIIADEICKRLTALGSKAMQSNDPEYMGAVNGGYMAKQTELRAELTKLQKEFPDKSEQELLLEIGQRTTQILMSSCNEFQDITMGNVNQGKFKTPAVIELGNKICECIETKSTASNMDDIIDDCLSDWTTSDEGLYIIRKEIDPDNYEAAGEFGDRLGKYLMTDCSIYGKWVTKTLK